MVPTHGDLPSLPTKAVTPDTDDEHHSMALDPQAVQGHRMLTKLPLASRRLLLVPCTGSIAIEGSK